MRMLLMRLLILHARVVRRLHEKAGATTRFSAASHRYLVIRRTDVDDEHHVRLV